jgi:hypothetical protein
MIPVVAVDCLTAILFVASADAAAPASDAIN